MRSIVAAATILVATTGCAKSGVLAAPDDYTAYRETRIAPTLDGRIAAAGRYLQGFPDGAFEPEVRAWFDRAEPVYFAGKEGTISGLHEYAKALPSGPHHVLATKEVGRLEAARDRHDLASADDVTADVDRATADRAAVRAELTAWIERFLDASLWDAPLSHAKTALIVPWSLSLPSPTCALLEPVGARAPGEGLAPPPRAARRCAKLLSLPYSVVVDGAAEAREATLEITVFQDADGRPVEARIGGPDLFLRVEETFTIRALPRGEPEPRIAAMARAAELVRGAFVKAVPAGSQCKRPPAAPVFLDLACAGLHVSVRSAVLEGEDDLILIRAATTP
ncbi:MAG: hypothetical protein ABJE95_31085 [Byssovorax sp.]